MLPPVYTRSHISEKVENAVIFLPIEKFKIKKTPQISISHFVFFVNNIKQQKASVLSKIDAQKGRAMPVLLSIYSDVVIYDVRAKLRLYIITLPAISS